MKPADRRSAILEAALATAQRHGLATMTRDHIAAEAGTSPGLVSARLGPMREVRREVRALAVLRGVELGTGTDLPGEREWLRGKLSRGVAYRLLATGPMNSDDLRKLVKLLQAQRAVLEDGGHK